TSTRSRPASSRHGRAGAHHERRDRLPRGARPAAGLPQGGAHPGASRRGEGAPGPLPALLLAGQVRGELPAHAADQVAAHLLSQRPQGTDPGRAPCRAGAGLTILAAAAVAALVALLAWRAGSLTED